MTRHWIILTLAAVSAFALALEPSGAARTASSSSSPAAFDGARVAVFTLRIAPVGLPISQ